MIFDSLKTQIKNIPPAELSARGVITPARTNANGEKTYICPLCGNGTGKSGDGIAFQFKDGAWLAKCFKCGAGFDNFNLLALHYGLSTSGNDFTELCKRAANDFGIVADFQDFHNLQPFNNPDKSTFTPPVKSAEQLAQEKKALEDSQKEIDLIKKDIAYAQEHLKELPLDENDTWRGLALETLLFFHCGYIADWTSPKARLKGVKNATPTPRVIIPSGDHYLARLTVPLETFKNAHDFQYIKEKPHAGSKGVFGIDTISNEIIRRSTLAQESADNKDFICILRFDKEAPRSRRLPAVLKSFSIEQIEKFTGEIPPLTALSVVMLVDVAALLECESQRFFFSAANKFSIDFLSDNETQISIESFGTTIKKKIPSLVDKITLEKIDALQPGTITQKPVTRIVAETVDGKKQKFSLPPNVRSITFRKSLFADVDNQDLPDFLKYTLKIFETAEYEIIEEEEEEEYTNADTAVNAVTEVVFVYEGEIDAMSTWQLAHSDKPTAAFIATGGASESNWIEAVDLRCQQLNIKPLFFISFDNDETGRKQAPLRVKELQQRGYSAKFNFLDKEAD